MLNTVHHFLIIQVGHEFALCDAWEFYHSWLIRRMSENAMYVWVQSLSTILNRMNTTKKSSGLLYGLFSKDPAVTRENNLLEYETDCQNLLLAEGGGDKKECDTFGASGSKEDHIAGNVTLRIDSYSL